MLLSKKMSTDDIKVQDLGCFTDDETRLLQHHASHINRDKEELQLQACAKWAQDQGYTHFALQDGGVCFGDTVDSTSATPSYAALGKVDCTTKPGYVQGSGNAWLNHVYTFDCDPACQSNETCNAGTCQSKCRDGNGCETGQTCNDDGACENPAPAAAPPAANVPEEEEEEKSSFCFLL